MYLLVHDGILRVDKQLQLAHANRVVQVPGMRWSSDTNSDTNTNRYPNADANSGTDADPNSASHAHANADSGSERPNQLDGYGSFFESD